MTTLIGLPDGNLHASTRCAEDGKDQSSGIPQVSDRPWGVKQG